MSFMDAEITQKGALYSAECRKCGCTMYVHEWATWDNNGELDAMRAGTLRCPECGIGTADTETFYAHPRKHYAGRYSASGYMDCTHWEYDTNLRRLERTLREYYGDTV